MECDEAARILHINVDFEAERRRPFCGWYPGFDLIENWLQQQHTNIGIHDTDKGQVILGYEIDDVSGLAGNVYTLVTAQDVINTLERFQTVFKEEMESLGADLSEVKLYPMESEHIVVKNPQPYMVLWK